MPFFRSLAVAALALAVPAVFAHESVTNPQKRAVEEFLHSVATGNPQNVAYAIHPRDLEELRTQLLSKLRAEAERGENILRTRLFGTAMPLAEIERLTMITFYQALSRKLYLFGREYDDFRYAGSIPEGDDKAHVVVRARLPRVRGVPGTVDVVQLVTIRKYGVDWKAALPSEIEAQVDDLIHGRQPLRSSPRAPDETAAGAAGAESDDSATPAAVRERLAAAEKALAESKCDEYYREHMSPNFRRVISKKALESLISSCENSIGNREMLLSTLRIVRGLEPRFEYNARRAVYDVSGQGLPFDRFALELVDRKWYIAE
jgi:hypothetical protein